MGELWRFCRSWHIHSELKIDLRSSLLLSPRYRFHRLLCLEWVLGIGASAVRDTQEAA